MGRFTSPSGKLLVAGGASDPLTAIASVEIYDPSTGIWFRGDTFARARLGHTATLLPDGNLLITGGRDERGKLALDSTELYIPDG